LQGSSSAAWARASAWRQLASQRGSGLAARQGAAAVLGIGLDERASRARGIEPVAVGIEQEEAVARVTGEEEAERLAGGR
jgi:hypothetical protein